MYLMATYTITAPVVPYILNMFEIATAYDADLAMAVKNPWQHKKTAVDLHSVKW